MQYRKAIFSVEQRGGLAESGGSVLRYISTLGRRFEVVGLQIASVSRVRNFSGRIVARSFHNACRAARNALCDAAVAGRSHTGRATPRRRRKGGERVARPGDRVRAGQRAKKERELTANGSEKVFRYDRNLRTRTAAGIQTQPDDRTTPRLLALDFSSWICPFSTPHPLRSASNPTVRFFYSRGLTFSLSPPAPLGDPSTSQQTNRASS